MSLFRALSSLAIEAFDETGDKRYQNAIFANGIWQKRKEPVGEFVVKTHELDGKTLGLTQECQFSFTPALPKMPSVILNNILEFYREVYKKHKSEVYISVYWDKVKQDYFLHVPKQQVSGATVRFENEPEMLNNPDYFIVMDSHSHNVMGAFWSAQDRQDQAASRLFSVLGKITSNRPEVLITAGSNRQEVKLKLDEAFDFTVDKLHEDSDYSVPADAFSKVEEYRYQAPAKVAGVGYGNAYPYYDDYYYGGKQTGNKAKGGTPAKSTTNTYQTDSFKAKTKLLQSINSYFATFNLSQVQVKALFDDFLAFFEAETNVKNIASCNAEDFSKLFAELDQNTSLSLQIVLEDLFEPEELEVKQTNSLTIVPDENEKNSGIDAPVQDTELASADLPLLSNPNSKPI